jgi:outer membrane protein
MREAVREAAVHRLRPIMLTALAAILAMIPLTRSTFWGPMAWAIMGGLMVATILTLIVLPALYELVFDRPQLRRQPGDFRMKHLSSGPRSWSCCPPMRPTLSTHGKPRPHDPDHLAPRPSAMQGASRRAGAALKRPSVQFQGGYQYNVTETNARLPEDLEPVFTGSRSVVVPALRCRPSSPSMMPPTGTVGSAARKAAGADVQFAGEQQQLILRVGQAYFKVLAARTGLLLSGPGRCGGTATARRAGAFRCRPRAHHRRARGGSPARRKRSAAHRRRSRPGLCPRRFFRTDRPADGRSEAAGRVPGASAACRAGGIHRAGGTPIAAGQAAEHQAKAAGAEIDRYGLAGAPWSKALQAIRAHRLGGDSGNGIVPDRIQSASAGLRITIPLYAGGDRVEGTGARANAARPRTIWMPRGAMLASGAAGLVWGIDWRASGRGAGYRAALGWPAAGGSNTGREVGIRTQDDVLNAQPRAFPRIVTGGRQSMII